MQDLLTPIAGIPGVAGAALFDDDDRCVAAALHPPLDEALIERAMRTLRQALVVLNVSFDSETTWSGLFLRCEGGHVIVKRVEGHTVLVVGEPSLNVAMINVGLNVAAISLRGDRIGRGTEPRGLLGPRTGQGSQPIPAQASPPDFLDPRHIPEAGGRTAFLIEAELAGIHAR